MRLVQSWEGLRRRWASLDSSGVGLSELPEVLLPVLVCGYESADQHRLLLGGTQIQANPGLFPWAGVQTDDDCWVEQISTHLSTTELALGITSQPAVPFVVSQDAWLETPSTVRIVRAPPGGSPALPAPISSVIVGNTRPWALRFNPPGFLLRAGLTLVVQTNIPATGARFDVVVREAGP